MFQPLTVYWYCPYTLNLFDDFENIRAVRIMQKGDVYKTCNSIKLCKTLSAVYCSIEKHGHEGIYLLVNCCDLSRHIEMYLQEQFPYLKMFYVSKVDVKSPRFSQKISNDKNRFLEFVKRYYQQNEQVLYKSLVTSDNENESRNCCPFLETTKENDSNHLLEKIIDKKNTNCCLCDIDIDEETVRNSINQNSHIWQDKFCVAKNYLMFQMDKWR